jgi:hypothetical protein
MHGWSVRVVVGMWHARWCPVGVLCCCERAKGKLANGRDLLHFFFFFTCARHLTPLARQGGTGNHASTYTHTHAHAPRACPDRAPSARAFIIHREGRIDRVRVQSTSSSFSSAHAPRHGLAQPGPGRPVSPSCRFLGRVVGGAGLASGNERRARVNDRGWRRRRCGRPHRLSSPASGRPPARAGHGVGLAHGRPVAWLPGRPGGGSGRHGGHAGARVGVALARPGRPWRQCRHRWRERGRRWHGRAGPIPAITWATPGRCGRGGGGGARSCRLTTRRSGRLTTPTCGWRGAPTRRRAHARRRVAGTSRPRAGWDWW